jgi:uncharacterized membrane protein
MGGRFWLGLMGAVIGIAIAAGIIFLIIGAALAAWGVLGALVFFFAALLLIAWFYDRRKQAQYDSL